MASKITKPKKPRITKTTVDKPGRVDPADAIVALRRTMDKSSK